MAGTLKDLRSILRQYKFISDASRIPWAFQVIALYCYSADSNFLKTLTPTLQENRKEIIFLHDILLTDGLEKLKCFLALPLSYLVQKNMIKVGCSLQIEKAKMCYLEGEYQDSHIVEYVVIEAVKVVEFSSVSFPNIDDLRFVESSNERESSLTPLVTGRKCYLNPWVPCVPSSEEWTDPSSLEYEASDSSQNTCLLHDLSDDWMRLPKPYPPIFVRVMARGILYYFGYSTNDRSYPFMASLIVADSSAACLCVCFGKVLVPFYYSAHPRTVLMIQNYKISRPHTLEHLPRLRGNAAALNLLDMQIVLGDYTKIQIVPPTDDLLRLQIASLPLIEFSFGNTESLALAADGTTIDVVGLITYVSLMHRFLYKYGKLHTRCYVELVDSSSFSPFVIILYNNGFRYQIEDLHPGQVLVATHMKVCHLNDELVSAHQLRTYLKATHYTEIFTSHRQESPYVLSLAVTAVASIIRDFPQEVAFIQNNMLRSAGFSTHILGFKTLDAYKGSFGDSLAGKMIPGAYWKAALDNLLYRERRFVSLGGFIIQVDYIDYQTVHSQHPVYGWSYASNVASRRTLFVNIKARYKLGNVQPLNVNSSERLMFPLKYTSDKEELFKAYRQFPTTDAAKWTSAAMSEIESLPALVDGYYVVYIGSLHFQALLQCLMIPQPSAKPHPSFIDFLTGNFNSLPLQRVGAFLHEPPRYTWDEVKQINMTASDVCDKTFVFAVELYRLSVDIIHAHLQRAYVCPPEQLQEALEADRVSL